jgi:hypothetical protein
VPPRSELGSPSGTRFLRDGFLVLERFLGQEEIRALGADVEAVLAAPLPPGCERPHNTLAPLRWNDQISQQLLRSDVRRDALSEAVGARDLRWISAYVSAKQAHSAALWWHQDWWCWDHPISYRAEAAQVAVLCYLTDTTSKNGALRVLPGTHHRSVALHATLPEAHTHEAGDLDGAHVAMRDHPDQVTLELEAGDAVVIDYRLLHSTHPNEKDERRDCLLMSFAPSWRDLPSDLRAHLIRHPALPSEAERASGSSDALMLLPTFDGTPRDLDLNRIAPSEFVVLN